MPACRNSERRHATEGGRFRLPEVRTLYSAHDTPEGAPHPDACSPLHPRARDHSRELPDDRPRHFDRHHGAADDPPRPWFFGDGALVRAERIYARLWRAASARCPRRRPPRPTPHVRRRNRAPYCRVPGRRLGTVCILVARRPHPAGNRSRDPGTGDARALVDELRRRARPHASGRPLRRRRWCRGQRRPCARRDADRLGLLVCRFPHQRTHRNRPDAGCPEVPGGGRAALGPPRPGGCGECDPRHERAGVRHRPLSDVGLA